MTIESILVEVRDGSTTVEEALENLAKLGYCPNLLNDDFGHWAVSFEGYQSLPVNPPDNLETSFYVEKRYWKLTILEALTYALSE